MTSGAMAEHERAIQAAYSVLVEVTQTLGSYRDRMVLVGGWVPRLLFGPEHTGSLDVDLALDPQTIDPDSYRTIRELLLASGYRQEADSPFSFYRDVQLPGGNVTVRLDFLSPEYGGTGKKHRTQEIQDIRARKARGCDLAFREVVPMQIKGIMPNGAENTVELNVCAAVPFIAMKGMAIHERNKPKDAYDLDFCFQRFPGGVEALAKEVRSFGKNSLLEEALSKIGRKFDSATGFGPLSVADYLDLSGESRLIEARRVFERFQRFFSIINEG
jgi:hypothetical protein